MPLEIKRYIKRASSKLLPKIKNSAQSPSALEHNDLVDAGV
jgi:hypothetical protein